MDLDVFFFVPAYQSRWIDVHKCKDLLSSLTACYFVHRLRHVYGNLKIFRRLYQN